MTLRINSTNNNDNDNIVFATILKRVETRMSEKISCYTYRIIRTNEKILMSIMLYSGEVNYIHYKRISI